MNKDLPELTCLQAELENSDCDLKRVLAELESVIKSPIHVERVRVVFWGLFSPEFLI